MIKYFTEIPNAPRAVGPYSPVVTAGPFAFLSGQVGIDPTSGTLVPGDVAAQTEQVLKNLATVLASLNLDFNAVAKSTIFLTSMNDFKTVNEIYGKALGTARPARSTIQVAGLPLGALVEIEMTALLT